jgi:hypothetical protein
VAQAQPNATARNAALPDESCEGVGIRFLLADAAKRLRDLIECSPKGTNGTDKLENV